MKKKNIEDYLAGTLLIDHDDIDIRFKPPIIRLYQDNDVEEWIGLRDHNIQKRKNSISITFPGIIVRHFSDGHSESSPIGNVIRIEMWPKATGAWVTIGCKREEYVEYVHFLHEKTIEAYGEKAQAHPLSGKPIELPASESTEEIILNSQGLQDVSNTDQAKVNHKAPYRLTEEEIARRKELVATAELLRREKAPPKKWIEIAKALDISERTLRDWRHNPMYQ